MMPPTHSFLPSRGAARASRLAWVLGLAAAAASLWCAPACATTMELYGFGPRAMALGNTAEAVADDFYAVYANPANLVLAKHIHFGFGTDMVLNRFGIDRQGGEDRWPTRLPQDNYLFHMGVSTPLPGWLEGRAALGVAFHLPVGGPTRLDSLDHRIPQLPMYDTLGDRLGLVLGLGVRPAPWLALGLGMQVLTALSGSADIAVTPLDHRVNYKALDVDLSTEVFPIVSATWTPTEALRLALVWRAESQVAYRLPLAVDLEGVGLMHFEVAGVGLWLPDTYASAISWQSASGQWLVTGGAAWQRWSQLPPMAPEVTLSLNDQHLVQPGGKAVDLLYARNQPVPMGARDIVLPRAGLEWRPNGWWTLRSGLQYRPTPFPRATSEANYLDAPATTVGLGAALTLDDPTGVSRRPLQLDASLAWTGLMRRTVQKNDPYDPVGGTSVFGDSWHVGLELHHDF